VEEGYSKDMSRVKKVGLPSLNLLMEVNAHKKATETLPGTNIKARVRTLLTKQN
jgi:hypothetical protein